MCLPQPAISFLLFYCSLPGLFVSHALVPLNGDFPSTWSFKIFCHLLLSITFLIQNWAYVLINQRLINKRKLPDSNFLFILHYDLWSLIYFLSFILKNFTSTKKLPKRYRKEI